MQSVRRSEICLVGRALLGEACACWDFHGECEVVMSKLVSKKGFDKSASCCLASDREVGKLKDAFRLRMTEVGEATRRQVVGMKHQE